MKCKYLVSSQLITENIWLTVTNEISRFNQSVDFTATRESRVKLDCRSKRLQNLVDYLDSPTS